MNPKVSIIIPCYNSEKYVEKTIRSALLQDYENYEVLAIDNESTDSTYQILLNLKNEFPNLILSSAKNIFKSSSKEPVEEGYRLMTGEYFTILDSDDFIKKTYIRNNMNYCLSSDKKMFVWQSQILGMNSDGGILDLKNHYYENLNELKEKLLSYCCINSPTVFYHKSLLDKGIIEERPDLYSGFCDYDKFCRIVDSGFYIYTSNKWFGHYYRWHDNQDTWKILNQTINYNELIQNFWRKKWKKLEY